MYKRESGFMEKHPDRVAQAERIQELSRQLNEGVVNFTATLESELKVAGEANKRGCDSQGYVDAKRDFEAGEQLLRAMKLKQSGK